MFPPIQGDTDGGTTICTGAVQSGVCISAGEDKCVRCEEYTVTAET